MIVTEYVIEKELVNQFIQYTCTNPIVLNGEERRLFIWGHEILLRDGKSNGKSGKLDIIGTDETGEVWLMEAKLHSNTEWHSAIWSKQLSLYAKSLQKRTEQEIVLSAKRYILKQSARTVFPSFISVGTDSLSDAFCQWAVMLNKSENDGLKLYEETLRKIAEGQLIHCVLSNERGIEIWQNQPDDDTYARAFITFKMNEAEIVMNHRQKDWATANDYDWSHGSWKTFMQKRDEVKATPDTVQLFLADHVVPIYDEIIAFISSELGWDGKFFANPKAFRFDLPTKYGAPIRIHIGWIDADGQVDLKYRTPYEYGLKFNIDFRFFKHHSEVTIWETGFALAKELAEVARYNIRGKEFSIKDPHWTAQRVKDLRWDGEMYRFISPTNRDYVGLEEEEADLAAALQFLKRIVVQ